MAPRQLARADSRQKASSVMLSSSATMASSMGRTGSRDGAATGESPEGLEEERCAPPAAASFSLCARNGAARMGEYSRRAVAMGAPKASPAARAKKKFHAAVVVAGQQGRRR